MKRFLQRNVETKLVRALIAGEIEEGAEITFTVQKRRADVGSERRGRKAVSGLR